MNAGALYQRQALVDVAVERGGNKNYVIRKLFPVKKVRQQGGAIYQKDPKQNRIRRLDTIVGAGGRPNRLRVSDPTVATYYCIKRALEGFVSDEERGQADVAVKTEIAETGRLTESLMLDEELEGYERVLALSQADTITTKWDASGGTPISDIKDTFGMIEKSIGASPDSLIIGRNVLRGITKTTEYKDTHTATMTPQDVQRLGTAAVLASLIDIPAANIHVPDCWVNLAPEGEDPILERVWEDTCVLFKGGDPDLHSQIVGTTLMWVGAPNTFDTGYQVEQMRDTDGRGGDKLWVRNWRDQKSLNPTAAFRFDACLTAGYDETPDL